MQSTGRTLARCVDIFALPGAVIYAGTGQKFDPALEVLDAELPLLERYWRELLSLNPSLEADLQDLDMQGYVAILREHSRVTIDDSRFISLAIVDWLADDLQAVNLWLDRNLRAHRGFNNIVTGRYLCPIFLDYEDKTVREALSRGTMPPTVGGPPTFLFDLEELDPGAPLRSFLRGPLIVWAWYHIFDNPRRRQRAQMMSLAYTSVARSHGMTRVTMGSIIYAATMVHFALSTTHSLYQQQSDIRVWHDLLVEFVNNPANLDIVESLLRWWNRLIFPIYASRTIPRVWTAYPNMTARGFTSG